VGKKDEIEGGGGGGGIGEETMVGQREVGGGSNMIAWLVVSPA